VWRGGCLEKNVARDALVTPIILHRIVSRETSQRTLRGGLVFKAHRLLYHSTLGSRVGKQKKKESKCVWRGGCLEKNVARDALKPLPLVTQKCEAVSRRARV